MASYAKFSIIFLKGLNEICLSMQKWDKTIPRWKSLFYFGAILLLCKKNSGWVGSSNAYNCLFALHEFAIFGQNLLIMWLGGFKNGEKYAYVMKVWPLMAYSLCM